MQLSLTNSRREAREKRANSLMKTLCTRRARRALKTWVAFTRRAQLQKSNLFLDEALQQQGGTGTSNAKPSVFPAPDPSTLVFSEDEALLAAGLELATIHSDAMLLRRAMTLWQSMIATVHEETGVLAAARRWHRHRVLYRAFQSWKNTHSAMKAHSRNLDVASEYYNLFLQHRVFHSWAKIARREGEVGRGDSADRELLATRLYYHP